KSEDEDVRAAAADILGKMGPAAKDAVPALLEARNDPDEGVREASGRALDRVAPRAPGPGVDGKDGDGQGLRGIGALWGLLGSGLIIVLFAGWLLARRRGRRISNTALGKG